MFTTLSKTDIIILATFILSSANAFNLVVSKILLYGKEWNKVEVFFFGSVYLHSEINQNVENLGVAFVKGWLVVLGFKAILTARVISWRSVTHMCSLAFSHQY